MKKNEWFKTWFNSPFYHILYQHRDFDEAEKFIAKILDELAPPKEAKIMDLACGKGRHAYFIAKQGYEVLGLDLSPESISYAQQHFRLDNLRFDVHDMRDVYHKGNFDFVLNFFTSFGYFDTLDDNRKVLAALDQVLKPGATLLIDFLNTYKAEANLVAEEIKSIHSIDFHLKRQIKDGFILKDILFSYKGEDYAFQERVQALTLADFEDLIEGTHFRIDRCFGNYDLDSYNEQTSDRLIVVFKKE